jgi:hypothetical protein
MRDLCSVAKQLRVVRNARRRFLDLAKFERDLINPALDRMAEELQPQPEPTATQRCEPRKPRHASD